MNGKLTDNTQQTETAKPEFSAWLPPPFADPGYRPGQHLSGKLAAIQNILPLPIEQVDLPDSLAQANLTESVLAASDSKAVIRLAHMLTSRQLNLVFPLLASAGPDKRPGLLSERLNLIVRERACPTLYASGWLTFQKHFPCPAVAHALAVLCKILEIKQSSDSIQPSTIVRPPIRQWPRISQLALPDSRQFIRRLIHLAEGRGLSLEQMMRQYKIHDDMPLGAELITQSFLTGDARFYRGGQHLFAKALQLVGNDAQAALINHFFSLSELPQGIYNRYCQEIFRRIGNPADDHPVWDLVKPKYCYAFQEWVLAATIGSHCRQQPEKARLYLRYIHAVQQVEHWDENTLLIQFPGFIVADCRQHPLLSICYDQPEAAAGHPFELATGEFNPNPASPAIPHRQVEDAIRRANLAGVVGLPFDAEGIRLTGIFLDLNLKRKQRRWRDLLPSQPPQQPQ